MRWHYQWIVVNDFLPKVVGNETARSVLRPGARQHDRPTIDLQFYPSGGMPFMPVEFSGAAYRFGHSMLRANYVFDDLEQTVPIFRPESQSGSGRRRSRQLSRDLEINWNRFFDVEPTPLVNDSMRIDRSLAAPLRYVPPTGRPLAWLNLRRGVKLKLPSGFAVAEQMKKKLAIEQLTEDQLLEPLGGANARKVLGDAVLQAPPLWYYVLCEARHLGNGGQQLGPLGAATWHALLGSHGRRIPCAVHRRRPARAPARHLPRRLATSPG